MLGLSRRFVTRAVFFSCLCLLTFARGAHAQAQAQQSDELLKKVEVDPERERAARGLFHAGSLAFDEGRFEDSLAYFKQAYEIVPKPKLLFNIGTALDRLRRDREALASFKEYLAKVPNADNRPEVEGRVRMLQASVDREDTAATAQATANAHQAQAQPTSAEPQPIAAPDAAPAPATQNEIAKEEPGLNPIYFYVAAGATVVVAGVSVWSMLDTNSALDDYKKDPTKKTFDDGQSKESRTNIMFIVTGVLAATTGTLAYFTFASGGSATEHASLVPWVSPDGGGAVARASF
jgi:tetratricopeptide (TPR) repeat protein